MAERLLEAQMGNDANYYRGFLDLTRFAKEGYYKPDTLIGSGYQERQPFEGARQGHKWINGALRPVDLFPNSKRYFAYMTQWEIIHSTLTPFPSRVQLSPVVDSKPLINEAPEIPAQAFKEYFPLIGHYGYAPAEKIMVPEKYIGSHGWNLDRLSELLANDVPAFVNNIDPGNGW